MSVKKVVKKSVVSVLFALMSHSVLAEVIQFDVLYDNTFKFVCSAESLKVDSGKIDVQGFEKCETGSSATFTDQSPNISVNSLTVTMDGQVQNFSVSKVYAGLDANGFLTLPIQLTLGPAQVANNPTPPVQVDTKNVRVIDPEQNGETFLPGCAGKTKTPPNECRSTGSIGSEIYAVKLDTSNLTDAFQLHQFQVKGITDDEMTNVSIPFRAFLMAISTTPGDFAPSDPACRQDVGSSDIVLNVVSGRYNSNEVSNLKASALTAYNLALSNPSDIQLVNDASSKLLEATLVEKNLQAIDNGHTCVLEEGQQYYVNVKPENPGCKAYINGVLTSPNGSCRIEVFANLPNKAAQ